MLWSCWSWLTWFVDMKKLTGELKAFSWSGVLKTVWYCFLSTYITYFLMVSDCLIAVLERTDKGLYLYSLEVYVSMVLLMAIASLWADSHEVELTRAASVPEICRDNCTNLSLLVALFNFFLNLPLFLIKSLPSFGIIDIMTFLLLLDLNATFWMEVFKKFSSIKSSCSLGVIWCREVDQLVECT